MITHHIGLLRQIISKRKQIKRAIELVLTSKDFITLTVNHEQKFESAGVVENDNTSLAMIGIALAQITSTAKKTHPELVVTDYLTQPAAVALGQLQKEGIVP